jgi:saccharopine dehydrogenase-like NADP-dependent oxidoreductase
MQKTKAFVKKGTKDILNCKMKSILILGAGRSSSALIDYFLIHAGKNQWTVTIGDISIEVARDRAGKNENAIAISFDITQESSQQLISKYDVIISLVPAHLHPKVARHCLQFGKHLFTASYVSDEMKSFDSDAKTKGLLFLNESGLDPGIDHMSAMQVIDKIRAGGGEMTSFESFTGGLIAPDTDPENPWRYKFTWNPRNVVMAGQGTAKFLQNGQYKYIPYQQLFKRITAIRVPGLGEYEGYANRDSLKYRETYGLQKIKTMLRGTLRNKGFCGAWDIFVQLGCTDDTYLIDGIEWMTHQDFLNAFLDYHPEWTVEQKLSHRFNIKNDGPEIQRLNWSGFFDNEPIGLKEGTPAQVLEHILNKRWQLSPQDHDLVVMWHRFKYLADGAEKEIQASLVARGENSVHTAMAKTVGLPLAIAAKLLLQGKISQRGVLIPVAKEFYDPILKELGQIGIRLEES